FKDNKITRIVINSRDISELTLLEKKLHKTLIQSEKLRSHIELLEKEFIHTGNLIFKSSSMQDVMNTIMHVAEFDSTLLLTGESGVGKEMAARFVHSKGPRKKASFIKVDCGAIPSALFESELFGYEKGSFTGAGHQGRIGLLELADKGTLLIDEVAELPLLQQVKLLRFIQDKEIVKVGGKETIPVDTRIIAATNKDLFSMVKSGTFRKDLYYRLNVVPLIIPPLRERREDIFVLIQFFLDKFNKKFGTVKKMDKECFEILEEYNWPGNVRELENMIERLIVLSSNQEISKDDLPEYVRGLHNYNKLQSKYKQGDTYRATFWKTEAELLVNVMKQSHSLREMSEILELDKSST
ncbi:MAG: sigma 54-interacting transcriptional regulator, partial [Spirochaetota bacterium]|nr:sigma 54-interacting transcriptional regulator [Spirochaetota bacterium]